MIEGLKREDLFVVVHEQVATDTVDYADIVLPATTQLEHGDIHSAYGHHFVMLNTPAIVPIGEVRSNNDVFRALASRLDFEAELFPDDETLIRECLDGGKTVEGITLEHLRETPSIRLNLDHHPAVRRRTFSHAFGEMRTLFRANEARRFRPVADLHAFTRRPANRKQASRFPLQLFESAQRRIS